MSSAAKRTTRKAVLMTKVMAKARKKIIKKSVHKATKVTGLSKEAVTTAGAVGFSAVQGRVSSRHFKALRRNVFGAQLQPVLEYSKKRKGQAALELSIEF